MSRVAARLRHRRARSFKQAGLIPETLEGRTLFSAGPSPIVPVATYDSAGLSSLSYNGTMIYTANGDGRMYPTVDAAVVSNGVTTEVDSGVANTHTTTFNDSTHQLIYSYAWGTVSTTFTQVDNRLNLTTTVNDTSSTITVRGVTLLMTVQFPSAPVGFNPNGPQINLGTTGPAVVTADYSTGSMAVVNDDGTQLMTGLFSSNESAPSNKWLLTISSMPVSSEPSSWARNYRSVAPGGTDTYHVSLRFGAIGATSEQLAPDAFDNVRKQDPDTAATWTDRRPIGMLTPADVSSQNKTATNPNGWFNDPNVNVTTPQGLAAFRTELLGYASSAVKELKLMNAQGVITWDMEGERYPSADYIGDPRMATMLSPELAYRDVIDAYFKTFTDAGLRVGVTVRPTDFQLVDGVASQVPVADQAAILIDKINYARQRWGATLFYIDSFSPAFENLQQDVLKRVAAAEPGVLLIPEHASTTDYAAGAPYSQINLGSTGTPSSVLQVYPNAFAVVNASGSSAALFTPEVTSQLTAAVERGDILMVNAIYDPDANSIVRSIYAAAAAAKAAAAPTNTGGVGAETLPGSIITTPADPTLLAQTSITTSTLVDPMVSTQPVTVTRASSATGSTTAKQAKHPRTQKKHVEVTPANVTGKKPVVSTNHFSLSALNWRLVSNVGWTQTFAGKSPTQ